MNASRPDTSDPQALAPEGLYRQAKLEKRVFLPRAKQWVDLHDEPDYLDLLRLIQQEEQERLEPDIRANLEALLEVLAHRGVPLGRESAFLLAQRSAQMSFLVWTNPGLTPDGEGRLSKHIRQLTQDSVQAMLDDPVVIGAVRAGEELPVEVVSVLENAIQGQETWWGHAADLAIQHIHTSDRLLQTIAEKNDFGGRRMLPLLGHPNLSEQGAARIIREAMRGQKHTSQLLDMAVEGRKDFPNEQVREVVREQATSLEDLQCLIRTGREAGDLVETIQAMKEKFPEQQPGLGREHIWGQLSTLPRDVLDELAGHQLPTVQKRIQEIF